MVSPHPARRRRPAGPRDRSGSPPGSRPEPAHAHPLGGSGQGASRDARPGGTDVARWRRGRPERAHPRPGMMWPQGPGRPAAKSTRGCRVQLSSLRLERMTRLLAPGSPGPRVAGLKGGPQRGGRRGPFPNPPNGRLVPEKKKKSGLAGTRRLGIKLLMDCFRFYVDTSTHVSFPPRGPQKGCWASFSKLSWS